MTERLVCITCPIGCRLQVERLPDGALAVSGNKCSRGAKYAEEELLSPRRSVSATCRSSDPKGIRVPCRTDSGFPKERVPELLTAIYALTANLPVRRGDVILADALGTGIDVIATRTIAPGSLEQA